MEIDTGGVATVDASGVSPEVLDGVITDDAVSDVTVTWLVFSLSALHVIHPFEESS